jgi:general secretion pathway protein A
MYTSFFGLDEKPFSITPDPRYLYMSERHTEALAHLIYGVRESGGFIQLTGEVGTGKTTLVRSLLQQIPDFADVALVLNPQISRVEFLTTICEELHVDPPESRASIKALTDALNSFLLTNHSLGRRTILIVDEAQNLRVEVLEQVRLLTNLETSRQKLLQIILIGQPELRDLLGRTDMRQLAQRITGRYHLEPLSREETIAYVDHRLRVAGAVGQIFSDGAKRELYALSGGIPRIINVIADRALLGAYTSETHQVSAALVKQAVREVYDEVPTGRPWWSRPMAVSLLAAAAIAVVLASGWAGMQWYAGRRPAPADAVAPAAAELPRNETGTAAARIVELTPLLDKPAGLTSTDAAFTTLFGLWQLTFVPGQRACVQAEEQGLDCLYQRGSLEQVQALGRPVILTLRDTRNDPHQVVLAGLGDSVAVIRLGDNDYRVATEELRQLWFGEYLLLWRPQTAGVRSFFPGMRDPDVLWLRESLASIQREPLEPMASDVYDDALAERVRAYQKDRNLPVDGLAGQATQAAINADLGVDENIRLAWSD